MSDRISTSDLARMLVDAARCLRERHEYLSELDCVAGDGDHGSTMLRAAEQLEIAAHDASSQTPGALLKDAGWKVLSVDGGASSALLGTFLTGMGDATGDNDLDCAALAEVFESGIKALFKQTKARQGDKTMVDALAPVVAAIRAAAEAGKTIAAALHDAAAAAQTGAESTKAIVARYGRARLLGEKTLGHVDAGAASIALIFNGFSEAFVAHQEN
jgi:dihydroxyacetone kinase-like protein